MYNSAFRGSHFNNNSGDGLFLELSARAVVGDSLFLHNKLDGIKVNNTSNVKIWNNTFIGNSRSVWLAQDSRRNTNRYDQNVDPRRPWPDPEMSWQLADITLSNNVIGLPGGSANCVLCVEDYTRTRSAESMGIKTNGNIYNRAPASSPKWLAVWSRGASNPAVFTSLAAFQSTTGQEARGREYAGTAVVSSAGTLSSAVQGLSSQVALGLPADVASVIGKSAGSAHLGAWSLGTGGSEPEPQPQPQPQPQPSDGSSSCAAAFQTKVTQLVNPVSQANLLTKWSDEATIAASSYGFTQNLGTLAKMAGSPGPGLVPVWRLNRGADFIWATEGANVKEFTDVGYVAQFVDFYASSTVAGCLEPVYRFQRGPVHRMAGEAKAAELVKAGWVKEHVAFYGEIG